MQTSTLQTPTAVAASLVAEPVASQRAAGNIVAAAVVVHISYSRHSPIRLNPDAGTAVLGQDVVGLEEGFGHSSFLAAYVRHRTTR